MCTLRLLAAAMIAVTGLAALDSQPLLGQVPSLGVSGAAQVAKRTRVVRFRVSEGTWMSLDVSPDGKTIVFDLLGDLYSIPIAGGRAQSLTTGSSWDVEPRFSPDGQRVAFVSDRSGIANLWIVDRTGVHLHQVSHLQYNESDNHITSPTWSPDGRTIVVAQRVGAAQRVEPTAELMTHRFRWLLAAYDIESDRGRWVSDTAASRARRALGPAFGPDGTIYAAVEPYRSTFDAEPAWHIERVDLLTGATRPEMAPALGRIGVRPAVSRDGRYLAYVSPSGSRFGLRLRDLRTFKERWLVQEELDPPALWDGGADGGARDLAPGYAFTPDSKAVVAAYAGRLHRIDLATGRVRTIPFAVDVVRELAPMALNQFSLPDTAVRTRGIMQPALSPDGTQVAFSALDRVWVMDLPRPGSPVAAPRRLTLDSVGEFYPSWSPDGQWIAYSTWQDGEGGAVRRARVGAAGLASPARSERLSADTALYFNTAVAPEGDRIAAVRARMAPERILTHSSVESASHFALVWIPAGGGAPAPIAPVVVMSAADGLSAEQESRSPTEQLYVSANRVHLGLTSFAWDGTDRRADIVIPDSEINVGALNDITGVVAPDGRRALVTHNSTLFELTLPLRRGDQPDTLRVEEARLRPFGAPGGAAMRWGRALAPWIAWSRDGRRVLFVQGGTLFVGDSPRDGWTTFTRIDVPLMVPVDSLQGTLVLRGARIITMHGGGVIARGDLVVRGNRIVAIGPVGTVPIPPEARFMDVTGETVLPGYVDIHDHLQYAYGVHGQCWACLVRLAHGVTSLRDPFAPPTFYNDFFTYRERERMGDLLGPRLFSTGIAHYRSDLPIESMDDARALVRPTADYFAAETFKEYSGEPWPARRLIAAAAAEAGLNATIHGDQLRAIVDGYSGIEHALMMPLYDDVLTFIAESQSTHTQTFGTSTGADGYVLSTGREPWDYASMRRFVPPSVRDSMSVLWSSNEVSLMGHPELDYIQPLLRNAAGIVRRGGRVGIGMHGNIPGMGIHYEMRFYALGGMSNHAILRSATIVSATAIGHANDLGSLEPGKLADLQVLDRNPLEDIRNTTSLRYVMKNGRLYQAEDLTEIWPDVRHLAPMYRWETGITTGPVAAGAPGSPAAGTR